jgi:hypothetical protein
MTSAAVPRARVDAFRDGLVRRVQEERARMSTFPVLWRPTATERAVLLAELLAELDAVLQETDDRNGGC